MYSQALLDKMKMIAPQYTVATKETDINEDEDELIFKVNRKLCLKLAEQFASKSNKPITNER